MHPSRSPLLALTLALLMGCDSAPPASAPATGAMRLAIQLPASTPSDVTSVTLVVSGPDMAARATTLVLSRGAWSGVIGDLPTGPQRTFVAQAFTASNVLRYQGRAEGVPVTAGATGLVSLVLQNVNPPAPLTNEAPVIAAVWAERTSVFPGERVRLVVDARDADAGDKLSYAWTAPVGAFTGPTSASTQWLAPPPSAQQGLVTVSITVSDARGASSTARLTLALVGGGWTPKRGLSTPRADHTATLLPKGRLLVTGGVNSAGALASAEVYDPATDTWSPTAPLSTPRSRHVAAVLPDGRVLVVGGFGPGARTAEVYDPAQGTWSPTGSLAQPRGEATMTPLPGGKLLVVGGSLDGGPHTATAEVYDPATGTWSPTASLSLPRAHHAAVALPSGKVLVVGGQSTEGTRLASAEEYDPVTGTWSPTASAGVPRGKHTALRLPSDKVLVLGGHDGSIPGVSELYDPATRTWAAPTHGLSIRHSQQALLLPSGQVLAAGGHDEYEYGPTAKVELYGVASGAWSSATALSTPRDRHTLTLLPSGKALVVGGQDDDIVLSTVEQYTPAP